MAFRREVHYRVGPVLGKNLRHCRRIADVGLHESIGRSVLHSRQRTRVRGIGQGIDIDHTVIRLTNQIKDESRADKAAATGYQNLHQTASGV